MSSTFMGVMLTIPNALRVERRGESNGYISIILLLVTNFFVLAVKTYQSVLPEDGPLRAETYRSDTVLI
jgi:hypothetical protein